MGLKLTIRVIRIVFMVLLVAGCSFDLPTPAPAPISTSLPTPSPEPLPAQAEITFELTIPNSSEKQVLSIDILDEVTGLGLNPSRYGMTAKDNNHYTIKLPFTINSVVKYRYNRTNDAIGVEYNAEGNQVRYRMLPVTGPSIVQDTLFAWQAESYTGKSGQIEGQVIDAQTSQPLADLLVTIAGQQTWTLADGSFRIRSIPVGTHQMVIYATHGAYPPFTQQAMIDAGLTTPVRISLTQSPLVNVNFMVEIPPDVSGVPLRLAGNLVQLGNTYADLSGGISTLASRMPVLTLLGDNQYSISLALPVGADISYKYTLGDGFWNSEQTQGGKFKLRQLIVPANDVTIHDKVMSWRSVNSEPITFSVKTPENTPPSDQISIQFNPFGWTEPIPMWSIGGGRWLYILYSPLNILRDTGYRYCRNDQCGIADDMETAGPHSRGWPFTSSHLPQTFEDDITAWTWLSSDGQPASVMAADIITRDGGFITGSEMQPKYRPSWQPRILPMLQDMKSISNRWVMLTPSWTVNSKQPFRANPEAGKDQTIGDLRNTIHLTNALKMQVAIYPIFRLPQPPQIWWADISADETWWHEWFSTYRRFILSYADLAQQEKIPALVIGGDWMLPVLPDGKKYDNSPFIVPVNSSEIWSQLIKEIRSRYQGEIFWAMPQLDGFHTAPEFIIDVDRIYLLVNHVSGDTRQAAVSQLTEDFGNLLDQQILPVQMQFKKPIILGFYVPALSGTGSDCSQIGTTTELCGYYGDTDQPTNITPSTAVDLQAQVDVYNAIFSAVNTRTWIGGVVIRGAYPPVALQDYSASIFGKPAYNVVWYWYKGLTGN